MSSWTLQLRAAGHVVHSLHKVPGFRVLASVLMQHACAAVQPPAAEAQNVRLDFAGQLQTWCQPLQVCTVHAHRRKGHLGEIF